MPRISAPPLLWRNRALKNDPGCVVSCHIRYISALPAEVRRKRGHGYWQEFNTQPERPVLALLCRYIFGDNAGGRVSEDGEVEPAQVAMTAPVRTEQPQKATVSMTSPVRTELKSNFRNMKVSFVMPKKVCGSMRRVRVPVYCGGGGSRLRWPVRRRWAERFSDNPVLL